MHEVRFSADGIRGIAGRWPFDTDGPAIIGRAIGRYLADFNRQPVVVVGRDTRASGKAIAAGLRAGLLEAGVNVINLGIMTTPGVAYLARRQQADLGISISASHNPPHYNGIKLVDRLGLRLQREDEMAIEALIATSAEAEFYPRGSAGEWTDGSHLGRFYIYDHAPEARSASLAGLKLVLDCAHGAASAIAPEVFRRLGADVLVVNADPNGENINHQAGSEHVRQHPEDLIRLVRTYGASYGFAFDGDGDRLVVVDDAGYLYAGDDLLFALATYFHARGELREATVVTTHTTNRGLDAALGGFGIRVIRVGKGDRAVEAAMWSGGGHTLGGEQVGNILINDGRHTAADAIYAATILADILHAEKVALRERVASYRKWPQILAAMRIVGEVPPDLGFRLEQHLREREEALRSCLGAECRALAWPSSTETGLVRLMVEGGATATIEVVREEVASLCRSLQEAIRGIGPCVGVSALSERGPYIGRCL